MRRGSGPTGRLLTHGYEATREAAVPAFRTRWRREQQMAKQKADRFQPSFRAVIRRSRNACCSRAFPWSRAPVAPPPSLVPRGWIAATLQHQALHAGSGLDQPAVDREVLAQAEACEPSKKGDRATFGGTLGQVRRLLLDNFTRAASFDAPANRDYLPYDSILKNFHVLEISRRLAERPTHPS